MVNVRADGIAVVLGPLLRDVRIVAAALVDVDSGMVLDAWSAGGAATGSPDLELIGAQHAEILRCALQLLRTWSGARDAAGACEVVLGADDGCRHLLRTIPDPLGDRLALAVVVDGPQRVLDRVRKRVQAVSVDALTAGPSMTRRPSDSGWSFDAPGPEVPAQSEPGAGLLPPGARPAGARPAPGPGLLPRPRDGRPVPDPGVPLPRDPGPAVTSLGRPPAGFDGPLPDRGFVGAVPAMAGLVGPAPMAAPADAAAADEVAPDGSGPASDVAATEVASAALPVTPAGWSGRRPVLFSVDGGGPSGSPLTPDLGEPPSPPAADRTPVAAPTVRRPPPGPPPSPRPPSPPAALPAPARPRPSPP